jgi:hypothetical protein
MAGMAHSINLSACEKSLTKVKYIVNKHNFPMGMMYFSNDVLYRDCNLKLNVLHCSKNSLAGPTPARRTMSISTMRLWRKIFDADILLPDSAFSFKKSVSNS